jgi:hypothetical protein
LKRRRLHFKPRQVVSAVVVCRRLRASSKSCPPVRVHILVYKYRHREFPKPESGAAAFYKQKIPKPGALSKDVTAIKTL